MHNVTTLPARGTVEFAAARVAKAFGVREWESLDDDNWFFSERAQGSWIYGYFNECGDLRFLVIEDFEWPADMDRKPHCELTFDDASGWFYFPDPKYNELMARGLFCLGFEDTDVLSQLPALSTHEKLELRLSMPREFWPPAWEKECQTPA